MNYSHEELYQKEIDARDQKARALAEIKAIRSQLANQALDLNVTSFLNVEYTVDCLRGIARELEYQGSRLKDAEYILAKVGTLLNTEEEESE